MPKKVTKRAVKKKRPLELAHQKTLPHAPVAIGQRFRLPPDFLGPIRLTEDDNGVHVPNRIQIFRTGTFKKLMPDGKSVQFSITRDTLHEIVENFKRNVRGTDLAVDFAHKSDEEAAGWIKDLVIQDDGHETQLWADVEWTTDGYAAVGGKSFRYHSPDFAFAWTDNETGQKYGATLFGVGLTNRPVIKHMAPTVELMEVDTMPNEELEALKLKFSEQENQIKALTLKLDEMAEDSDDGDDDDDDGDEDGSDSKQAGDKPKKKAATPEMNLEELKAAYQKVCDEMSEMKKGMAQSLAEAKTREKEAKFTVLLSEGKVVPAQKDAFMKDDTVKFAELSEKTKFTALGERGEEIPTNRSAQDEVLRLAEEKVSKGQAKRRDLAIPLVLAENKKLQARYDQEMSDAARE